MIIKNLFSTAMRGYFEFNFVISKGRKIPGALGTRMTGAGFGGCTVAIIKTDCMDAYIETVGKLYEVKFGHKASFYVTDTGDGGREL